MVGIYASSMPAEQFARNGEDTAELKPIIDAIGGGDLAKRRRVHVAGAGRAAVGVGLAGGVRGKAPRRDRPVR
jgi:hypothetical protein